MKLTLRLAERDSDTGQSRMLEHGTLAIGRGAENDWVLLDPDRTLSKNHCRIDASDGGFMLTDLSTNGVFLAGAAQPIGRGHSCALEDGDSFSLGPYRLSATIADEQAALDLGYGRERDEEAPSPISPIAPAIEEPWLSDIPGGAFGPARRAAPERWDAPPDPATYAASGLFEQPDPLDPRSFRGGGDSAFESNSQHFSQLSEHIDAASTVMRLPEAQVVLPTDWNDVDPVDHPAISGEAPGAAAAPWPPLLPPEPETPAEAGPAPLPEGWIIPDVAAPAEPEPVPEPAAILPSAWAPAPVDAPVSRPPPPAAAAAARPRPELTPPPRRAAPPPPPVVVPPPPAPPPAAFVPAAADTSGLIAAFLEGAGLPATTLDEVDQEAAFREIGEMVRAAVEGVRDILSTRALVKSEFRVDQTVLRRTDNNAMKFAPDAQRCLAAMVGAAPPGFLPGAAAMQQSMDDIKLHELALVAALNGVFAELGRQLDPDTIMAKARQESGIGTMLPYAREAKCWAMYSDTYRLIQDSGASNTGGSLLAPLAQAYARQLRRVG